MKKSSLVKEFKNINKAGLINMNQKNNFLCSNLMDIEDILIVSSNKISDTYHDFKQNAITIKIDTQQTKDELENLTKQILSLDSKKLLLDYLYNEIYTENPNSIFKQIDSSLTLNKKSNLACIDYINYNIISKYKIKDILLYTVFYELKNNTVAGSGSSTENPLIELYSKTPVYSHTAKIISPNKKNISFKQYNDGLYEISYKQEKISKDQTFTYYYDVIYERI